MQGESKQTALTANFIWDNGNLLVSPPFGAENTAPSWRQLRSSIKTIYERLLCKGH